jgi:hypothetical protein
MTCAGILVCSASLSTLHVLLQEGDLVVPLPMGFLGYQLLFVLTQWEETTLRRSEYFILPTSFLPGHSLEVLLSFVKGHSS